MNTHSVEYPARCAARTRLNPQKGAALFVVVMMSLVVSLLAAQLVNRLVFGGRGAMFEQDLAQARNAAEAALRDAENDIRCYQWDSTRAAYKFVANSDRTSSAERRPHCDRQATDATKNGAVGLSTGCDNGYILKDPSAVTASPTKFYLGECKTKYGTVTKAPSFTAGGINSDTAYYTVEVILVPNGQVGQNIPYYRIRATGSGRKPTADIDSTTKVTLEAIFRPL